MFAVTFSISSESLFRCSGDSTTKASPIPYWSRETTTAHISNYDPAMESRSSASVSIGKGRTVSM